MISQVRRDSFLASCFEQEGTQPENQEQGVLGVGINKWAGLKERHSMFQILESPYWTVEELHGQEMWE